MPSQPTDPSSLKAALKELEEWNQLTPTGCRVRKMAWLKNDFESDDELHNFDPSTPTIAWPTGALWLAWKVILERFRPNGDVGLSKDQTASLDAVWCKAPPASRADVDPDVEKFGDALTAFRQNPQYTTIVITIEIQGELKLLARFAADWTYGDSKVGGVRRAQRRQFATEFDNERDGEGWEQYPASICAFTEQADSLLNQDIMLPTSESHATAGPESIVTAAPSKKNSRKAWIVRNSKAGEIIEREPSMLSRMLAFEAALKEGQSATSTSTTSTSTSVSSSGTNGKAGDPGAGK